MNTSDILNRAADLIEERGWTQGEEGWSSKSGGLCVEGALIAALGGRGFDDRSLLGCPAYTAVSAYLDDHYAENLGLWAWNDRDDRTQAEVIEVLRATALVEAARETQPAEVAR